MSKLARLHVKGYVLALQLRYRLARKILVITSTTARTVVGNVANASRSIEIQDLVTERTAANKCWRAVLRKSASAKS